MVNESQVEWNLKWTAWGRRNGEELQKEMRSLIEPLSSSPSHCYFQPSFFSLSSSSDNRFPTPKMVSLFEAMHHYFLCPVANSSLSPPRTPNRQWIPEIHDVPRISKPGQPPHLNDSINDVINISSDDSSLEENDDDYCMSGDDDLSDEEDVFDDSLSNDDSFFGNSISSDSEYDDDEEIISALIMKTLPKFQTKSAKSESSAKYF